MDLPTGWESDTDATGRPYYFNHEHGRIQWDPPTAAAVPSTSTQPPSYANKVEVIAAPCAPVAVPEPQYAPHSQPLPQVIVVDQDLRRMVPQNAPEGGEWIQEKYCGLITWLVGLFVFPYAGCCIPCCPCDERTVYIVNDTRYNKSGTIVSPSCCRC